MSEAAPAAAGAAAEKKPRLLRRIPTSVAVTLLGVALTAWLLPAFTRQWDDRQKAQEFKAAVAVELAAATSGAVLKSKEAVREDAHFRIGCHSLCISMVGPARTAWNRMNDAWLVDSVRIESKLRAYFPLEVVLVYWRRYENTIGTLFQTAITSSLPADLSAAKALSGPLGVSPQQLHTDLATIRLARRRNAQYASDQAFNDIVKGVLRQEDALASVILASHITGYSTNTHDLLHDLIPG